MISAAVRSSFLVFRMRPCGSVGIVVRIAAHERHHGDAGLEPRQSERELGKDDQCRDQHHRGRAVLGEQPLAPPRQVLGMMRDLENTPADDYEIQSEINARQ